MLPDVVAIRLSPIASHPCQGVGTVMVSSLAACCQAHVSWFVSGGHLRSVLPIPSHICLSLMFCGLLLSCGRVLLLGAWRPSVQELRICTIMDNVPSSLISASNSLCIVA